MNGNTLNVYEPDWLNVIFFPLFRRFIPNVVADLTLVPRIWEFPGSTLVPETGYPDRFFVVFLSHYREMSVYLKIRPRPLPYTFFQIHHSLITLSLDAM
jgi:hypothetical protein